MATKTYIIAEAGVNHNGNIDLAKKMVDVSVEAGVDCIKFQTFRAENLVTKFAEKANYQKKTTAENELKQFEMLKKLELTYDNFIELKDYCELKKMTFLSTPFDIESINFLNKIDMPFWKIPSGELTNLPYIEKIAKTNKPIVLSTGMATIDEIKECVSIIKKYNKNKLTLLHCNTEYPTPFEDVNLLAMLHIKNECGVEVGYSDHSVGIEVPIAAVALGATIIEKHFTLDRNMDGPDHKSSLEPKELKLMVDSIRNIDKALGNGQKIPTKSELANLSIARKSIVAMCNIKKGELFTEENITTKRPANGLSPMLWNEVLGKTAVKDFVLDDFIEI